MTRAGLFVLPAVLLLAPATAAQIPAPWDRPPGYGLTWGPHHYRWLGPHGPRPFPIHPIAPIVPISPFGFGTPVFVPTWGGFGGGAGVTTNIFIENHMPPQPAALVVPLDPAHLSSGMARLRAAQTADTATITTGVTLTLPAEGEVWMNGLKQLGIGRTFDLTVTTARPGESVPFAITARWTINGQTYDYKRSLTLLAGERQSLTVVRGTLVE